MHLFPPRTTQFSEKTKVWRMEKKHGEQDIKGRVSALPEAVLDIQLPITHYFIMILDCKCQRLIATLEIIPLDIKVTNIFIRCTWHWEQEKSMVDLQQYRFLDRIIFCNYSTGIIFSKIVSSAVVCFAFLFSSTVTSYMVKAEVCYCWMMLWRLCLITLPLPRAKLLLSWTALCSYFESSTENTVASLV